MRAMVLHAHYDLTAFELHRNQCSLYDAYSLMLRTKTNLKTDKEQIKCADSQATYIGETGRNLITRLNEHERATKKCHLNNNIADTT